MTLQLKLTLEESNPTVWRRMLIPSYYTFYQLHMAIQGAFGWNNCHLFQFCQKDLFDKLAYSIPDSDFDEEMPVKDTRKSLMTRELKRIVQRYTYIYDFGDGWVHRILVEKVDKEEITGPYCLGGKGDCPPEDVGGMTGYQEMLKVLGSSRHPEKQSYRQWIGLKRGENWDAKGCNLKEINKRLLLLR